MDERPRTDTDLAALLEATERRRLRALVDADLPTADALHADDYELITPGGSSLSK
ncbi:MAG TPA: nuclear transport factor 2 family protein, partial [Candidatus Limnocylindria bacterium]|nr:nuclear transport factor 2 family protein [Candidatus Limnocylindria bacterium]